MVDVNIDRVAVEEFLNDPAGPVGIFLAEAADFMAGVAKAKAPVMKGKNYWNSRSNAVRPPGTTKASVHSHGPFLGINGLYASANALADPSIFLEKPAVQMHHEFPFLTTGL